MTESWVVSLDEVVPYRVPDRTEGATFRGVPGICPLLISLGVNLGHGTGEEVIPDAPYLDPDFTSYYGTQGMGFSNNGTLMYLWDDVSFSNVVTGDVDKQGYTIITWPEMNFVAHYPLRETDPDGAMHTDNITSDNEGNIYYWGGFDSLPLYWELIRQNGDTSEVLDSISGALRQRYGPIWNPYDGLLYDLAPDDDGNVFLESHETDSAVTPLIDGPVGGFMTSSNYPAVAPDGGLWFSLDEGFG